MQTSPLLENLIESLRVLPGVGPKSAQRMAYHLLQRNRSGGMRLAQGLTEAMSKIGHCEHCRTFTEEEVCQPSPSKFGVALCSRNAGRYSCY